MSSWNSVAQMEARIAQVQELRTKPHRKAPSRSNAEGWMHIGIVIGVIVIAIKIAQTI